MEEDSVRLGAEISKINFLLENLYALVLRQMGATHDDIPHLADEMCRQGSLPATNYGPESAERLAAIQELSEHRIAVFFSGVQKRIESDQAPPRPQ